MNLRGVVCGLVATILMTSGLRGDEPAPELNGRWIVTRLVIDGVELSVKSSEPFSWDVDGAAWRYAFVVDGERKIASFKVSLTKSDPATRNDPAFLVDARLRGGAFAGQVCKGVCRIDGDVARLCLAGSPSVARPGRFQSSPESGLQLFEMRREKAAE